MPEDEVLNQLQALAAIAAEQEAVLAFSVDDDSDNFEPVFMRIFRANADEENESALIAVSDLTGLSLGRFVVGRGDLDEALAEAEEIVDEPGDEAQPTLVPIDWEAA